MAAIKPIGSVRAANLAAQQKKPVIPPSNIISNAKTAAGSLPMLNTSSVTPPKTPAPKPVQPAQQAQAGASYIKKSVAQPAAQGMAQGITNIRAQQNAGQVTPEKPLASNVADQAAIIKGRGQIAPKPTVLPKAQQTPEAANVAAATTVSTADNTIQNVAKDSNDYTKQLDDLKNANLEGEEGYRDAIIQGADERYNAEQTNLDKLQQIQDDSLAARNQLTESGSDIQRQDAQNAYDRAKAEYDLQRERLDKANQDRIIEQKAANTERQLQTESRLAALGGYGSLVKNQELSKITIENDRLLNSLVFQRDTADKEIANNLVALSNDYQSNLSKIEQTKQETVQSSYDKYLEYVTKIQNDREMSVVNKQSAIAEAQAKYKQNVAKINQDSFDQKYEISERMAAQAREIKEKDQTDAREIMGDILTSYAMSDTELTPTQKKQLAELEKRAGYPAGLTTSKLEALKQEAKVKNLQIEQILDDEGNVTYVSVDKSTGQIVNHETLEGIGKAAQDKYQLSYDPIWGNATVFNSKTGKYEKIGGSQGFSTMGGQQAPAGTQVMGGNIIDNKEFNKAFKVGQNVGLWCGTYASTVSTARRVGDTWNEKLKAIDKKDNPKPGDKLLVPLGVKSDGSGWGHVAVVTNYDPTTGNITVVESNKDGKKQNTEDGKGTVTTGVYNINKLNASYSNNWGFASGEFKPEIKKQLDQGIVPNSTNIVSSMGGGQKDFKYYLQEGTSQGMPPKVAIEYAQTRVEDDLKKTQDGEEFDKEGFNRADKLRDEFNARPAVKNYQEIRDNVNDFKNVIDLGVGGPGDLALVYSFMKSLDPSSVVRETEFDSAAKSGNIFSGTLAKFNGYFKDEGGILPNNVKQSFLDIVKKKLETKKKAFDQEYNRYNDLADKSKVDKNYVTVDYGEIDAFANQNNNLENSSNFQALPGGMSDFFTGIKPDYSQYANVGSSSTDDGDFDFYNKL